MRRVLGWLLVVLALLTLLLIVLAVVVELVQGETDGLGALTLVVVPALLLAVGRALLAPRARLPTPTPVAQPTDRAVYRQRCCQVPVKGSVVALGLTVAGYWLTVAPVPALLQDVMFLVAAVPAIYLFAVLIYLPYGIRIGEHTLTVGVRGVPRFGRGWRSVTMPLTEVLEWRILRSLKDPGYPSVTDPRTGKRIANSGSMCGPGPNHVLVVRYDPRVVAVPFPAVVMQGYGTTTPEALGVADTGYLTVLTNRPRRLRAALEAALPGRKDVGHQVDPGRG